jgi:cytidine deaminase
MSARRSSRPQASRDALVQAAAAARERAHAPYSRFLVGAALRTRSGRVYTGCNVENASYGLSVCAERVAAAKAVSEGDREFVALAVVTSSDPPSPPCGACRQFLAEFAADLEIVLANLDGGRQNTRLAALLPRAFRRSFL